MKRAFLDLRRVDCTECMHIVQRKGRRIPGVKRVEVSAGEGRIYVVYEGRPDSVEGVARIVKGLGYNPVIRWDSVVSVGPSDVTLGPQGKGTH